MNSVEALEYAIRTVRAKRVIAPELASKEAALETLIALRDHIAERQVHDVSVVPAGSLYQARCSCDWQGHARSKRAVAEQDARDHQS